MTLIIITQYLLVLKTCDIRLSERLIEFQKLPKTAIIALTINANTSSTNNNRRSEPIPKKNNNICKLGHIFRQRLHKNNPKLWNNQPKRYNHTNNLHQKHRQRRGKTNNDHKQLEPNQRPHFTNTNLEPAKHSTKGRTINSSYNNIKSSIHRQPHNLQL